MQHVNFGFLNSGDKISPSFDIYLDTNATKNVVLIPRL
jgi:hypothetical protein